MNQKSSEDSVKELAMQLKQQCLKLVTAESCTGGLVAQQCTDQPGSSDWFERGFITYSNIAKTEMLGVNSADINQYGAVSQEVVENMAKGAVEHSHSNCAIAITGIAGPSGGSKEKPVGTVWIAWAAGGAIQSRCYLFTGNRNRVREQAANKAINGLISMIEKK